MGSEHSRRVPHWSTVFLQAAKSGVAFPLWGCAPESSERASQHWAGTQGGSPFVPVTVLCASARGGPGTWGWFSSRGAWSLGQARVWRCTVLLVSLSVCPTGGWADQVTRTEYLHSGVQRAPERRVRGAQPSWLSM